MDIAKNIGVRLTAELKRKGLTAGDVAKEARLENTCVDGYLNGSRTINFDELKPMCSVLGIRIMRLLGPSFEVPHLQYRAASLSDRMTASDIENTFLQLADFLPKPASVPSVPTISERETDIQWLLTEVRHSVEALRKRFQTTEALYDAAALAILPISAGSDAFDAFLMTVGKRAVVCVNRDKPPARIHFSLLHEMAHYLFHKDRDIPLDILGDDYYAETIKAEVVPEYVANKFAQQYLIPFDLAENLATRKIEPGTIGALVAERRTTPQVLANALYDCLRLRTKRPRYTDLCNELKENAGTGWGRDRSILDFVENKGSLLRQQARDAQSQFSEEVWESIWPAWELDRG